MMQQPEEPNKSEAYINTNLHTSKGEINGTVTIHIEHVADNLFIPIFTEIKECESKIAALIDPSVVPMPPILSEPDQKVTEIPTNKWQIPFDFRSERREYDAAYHMCRKYNLPYPEALKKEQEKKPPEPDWKIPFSSKTQRRKYDVAYLLCKKHNLPYPEAIEKEQECNQPKKRPMAYNNKWRIPFDRVTQNKEANKAYLLCKKYNLPYPEALKRQQEEETGVINAPPASDGEPIINIKGGEGLDDLSVRPKEIKADDLPKHGLVHVKDLPPIVAPPTFSTDGFKVNDHVKQIKEYNGKIVPQIGVVGKICNGFLEVSFGGTKYTKLPPDCLEIV